jgi:hypothetical protein
MVSLAKSAEPSALQTQMPHPSLAVETQVLSALPAKKRDLTAPRSDSKEWMHACCLKFRTLISPHHDPEAKRLESVRKKDNAAEQWRLPKRILLACFVVHSSLSVHLFPWKALRQRCNKILHARCEPIHLGFLMPDALHPTNVPGKSLLLGDP